MKIFNSVSDLASASLVENQFVETYNTTANDKLGSRYFIESANYIPNIAAGDVVLSNGNIARYILGLNKSKVTDTSGVLDVAVGSNNSTLTDRINVINSNQENTDQQIANILETIATPNSVSFISTSTIFNSIVYDVSETNELTEEHFNVTVYFNSKATQTLTMSGQVSDSAPVGTEIKFSSNGFIQLSWENPEDLLFSPSFLSGPSYKPTSKGPYSYFLVRKVTSDKWVVTNAAQEFRTVRYFSMPDLEARDTTGPSYNAFAFVRFRSDGVVAYPNRFLPARSQWWASPTEPSAVNVNISDYEVKLEVISGNPSRVGNLQLSTWYALSSDRDWEFGLSNDSTSPLITETLLMKAEVRKANTTRTVAETQFKVTLVAGNPFN